MSSENMHQKICTGTAIFDIVDEISGTIHHVTNDSEVRTLAGGDLSDVIALVRAGTATFASPLLVSGVHGLLTLEGAPESHLGIVANEFNIPCIMSIEPEDNDMVSSPSGSDEYFEELGRYLDGRRVRLESTSDGAINRGEVYDIGGAE